MALKVVEADLATCGYGGLSLSFVRIPTGPDGELSYFAALPSGRFSGEADHTLRKVGAIASR